jgi:hypothetical protein
MRRGERPMRMLPRPLLLGFALLLLAQIVFHHSNRERLEASYEPLTRPHSARTYEALAMGSDRLLGYLLALRLQLHDNQAGQHFRYSLMDYDLLVDWLDILSDIDADSEYPMLLASRIYTQTGSAERLRKILDFIERRFDDNPQLHWRRLAEACLIAKHKLDDLELALRLAGKLAAQPASVDMPHWARDFEFLLLAEMNETESAIAIIQALLQSGSIKDPDERRFLREKLLEFQQTLFESQQIPEN